MIDKIKRFLIAFSITCLLALFVIGLWAMMTYIQKTSSMEVAAIVIASFVFILVFVRIYLELK